jgi:hypothetical protein
MSTPEIPSSPPVSDSVFLSGLIPNLDMARFSRAAVLLFLAFSAIGCLGLLWTVSAEFHARHSWPVARGEVVSCEEKNAWYTPGTRHTRYWMECEVKFDVPADECLTGVTAADTRDPYPCFGTVRSRATTTWGVTNGLDQPSLSLHPQENPSRSPRPGRQVRG